MGGHLVAVPVLVSASGGAADAVAGNAEVPTRAGLANFTDLAVNAVGAGFVLTFDVEDACCGAAPTAASRPFNVSRGARARLAEAAAPGAAQGGQPFGEQPTVQVRVPSVP
jgi:hypothetical protein